MIVDKSKWQKTTLEKLCKSGASDIVISKTEIGIGKYKLYGASGFVGNVDFYHNEEPYLGLVKDGSGVGRIDKYPAKSSLVGTMQYLFPTDLANIDFLKYLIEFLNLAKYVKGAAIPHIYYRHYKNEKVTIPNLAIQSQIASELDAIQTMIEGYKAQLIDLDELIKSIFNNSFGDIHSNPNNFEIKLMQDVCSKITDGTHNPPKFVDSGIPFIFVSNIANYEISYLAKKHIDDAAYNELWKSTPVEVGDIVYTSVGSYGNPAIVRTDKKFMFQRHIALLKPKHDIIESEYLKWFLISPSGREQADNKAIGAAQKTLNLKAIKTFKILVPPKDKQQNFTAQVEVLEKQRALLQEQLADAEQLMAERMQFYFS